MKTFVIIGKTNQNCAKTKKKVSTGTGIKVPVGP